MSLLKLSAAGTPTLSSPLWPLTSSRWVGHSTFLSVSLQRAGAGTSGSQQPCEQASYNSPLSFSNCKVNNATKISGVWACGEKRGLLTIHPSCSLGVSEGNGLSTGQVCLSTCSFHDAFLPTSLPSSPFPPPFPPAPPFCETASHVVASWLALSSAQAGFNFTAVLLPQFP